MEIQSGTCPSLSDERVLPDFALDYEMEETHLTAQTVSPPLPKRQQQLHTLHDDNKADRKKKSKRKKK